MHTQSHTLTHAHKVGILSQTHTSHLALQRRRRTEEKQPALEVAYTHLLGDSQPRQRRERHRHEWRVNTSAGDRLCTNTQTDRKAHSRAGTRTATPQPPLWLLSTEGLYTPAPKLCRCWELQGDEAELGSVPQDGSVLEVHLPGVGTLHTDPG